MEDCLYYKKGLCEKANKAVESLDTEDSIACYCIEHDIMRVLEKCKDFSPVSYSNDFRGDVLKRIAEIKQTLSPKSIREKKTNLLADNNSATLRSNSQQVGNLIVLLQYHNFGVVHKELRYQVYELMKELKIPLDKDMKLDKNKLAKKF